MIPTIPLYVTLTVLVVALGSGIAVWRILASGVARSGLATDAQRRVRAVSAVFLAAWFLAALVLAPSAGSLAHRGPFYVTPLIPVFAILSVAFVLIALWRSDSFRNVLDATSIPALIGVQVYRAIGVLFLILYALGQLPGHFAMPAGWGDVAVGLAAPFVALALGRGGQNARTLAIVWNAVGLFDLVVAVGMGTGLLTPLLLGAREPAAGAMGVFPLFLVPAFVVPISVLLHVLALRGLLRATGYGARLAPAGAR